MTTVAYTLMAIAAFGILLTSVLAIQAALFLRRRRRPFAHVPPSELAFSRRDDSIPIPPQVSILKPLCGLEDGLEENLESFAKLQGLRYEVICSVADSRDPAIAVFEKVRRRFPESPFRIVVGNLFPCRATNRKIERLVQAAHLAKGQALALVPLADLLQFAAQVVPYFSREVEWHGFRARLGPGTRIEPVGARQLAVA